MEIVVFIWCLQSERVSVLRLITRQFPYKVIDHLTFSYCLKLRIVNMGLDIATALRLIATSERHISSDRISSLGENDNNDRSSLSLFEREYCKAIESCKFGHLQVNSLLLFLW